VFDETPAEAWTLRFGSSPPALPELGKFLNHRSVRHYKPDPIPETTLQGLLAAAQSAATSSNLQLWSVVSIQDGDRRERMAMLCDDQDQVRHAACFLAFLVDHRRLTLAANHVGCTAAGLDLTEFYTMAVVDAALAAERLVCSAESLGLGICYIGALRDNPDGVAAELALPHGVFGLFGLALGWPEEPLTAAIKPRLAPENVWFREQYADADVAEYDARMREFYEAQKMKGDVTWSMRSGRRVNGERLKGREHQLEWLKAHGFLVR